MNNAEKHVEYLTLKPYKCYLCEGLIGMSSDNKLYIGAAIFVRSVTMECGYCGRHTYWRPSNESVQPKKAKSHKV